MKTLFVFLLPCVLSLASAASREGYIYTHDVQQRSSSSRPESVSSDTAFEIWARRLQQSTKRRLGSVDESVLEQIDRYGGHQTPMFADVENESEPSRLSIIIEGYDDDAGRLEETPNLNIAKPSQYWAQATKTTLLAKRSDDFRWSFDTAERIEVDLRLSFAEVCGASCQEEFEESLSMRDLGTEHLPRILSHMNLELFSPAGNKVKLASLYLDYTQMTDTSVEKKSELIRDIVSQVHLRLDGLAASGSQESTVILLPTSQKHNSEHMHHARQSPEDEEEPLSVPTSSPLTTLNPSNSTYHPPLGPGKFLPLCFSSADACANATNSCSGHGSPYKKRANCYACKCSSTVVRHNDDGTTKSVQWGGTACEKKDVSVEFFLFASFGVVMSALVAGGIGMLWSMGAEELPSVIGAGVAGPRAQK